MSDDALDWTLNPAGKASEEATKATAEALGADEALADIAGGAASPTTGSDDALEAIESMIMPDMPAPPPTGEIRSMIDKPPEEMPSMSDDDIRNIQRRQTKRKLASRKGRASTFMTGGRSRTLG